MRRATTAASNTRPTTIGIRHALLLFSSIRFEPRPSNTRFEQELRQSLADLEHVSGLGDAGRGPAIFTRGDAGKGHELAPAISRACGGEFFRDRAVIFF